MSPGPRNPQYKLLFTLAGGLLTLAAHCTICKHVYYYLMRPLSFHLMYYCTMRSCSYSVPSLAAANTAAGGKNVAFFGPNVSLGYFKFTFQIYIWHLHFKFTFEKANLNFKAPVQFKF